MSLSSIDVAWCPVCDQAILPKRIQVPIHDTQSTRRQFRKQYGRAPKKSLSLLDAQPSQPVKTRTIISQEPDPYYCSDDCRLQDLQNELESLHLYSATPVHTHLASQDFDDPIPLRVPHNTPCDSRSTPSPVFNSSSGTESDDSAESYSPTQVLRNLPPLRRKPSKKISDSKRSVEFPGGAMMAAKRIQAAFASASDTSLPGSSRKQVIIPGWTDGDRTNWRASVYAGSTVDLSKGKYTSIDASNYTGGSFSAQAARRVAGEQEPPKRTLSTGHSAPQFSVRAPLQYHYRPAFRRTEPSAYIGTSPKDIALPTPPEESVHPLLSHSSLRGKLLIPKLRAPSTAPSRSDSASDLIAFNTGSTHRSSINNTKTAEPTVERECFRSKVSQHDLIDCLISVSVHRIPRSVLLPTSIASH
jgi:hypothetical protein